jgi:hypothetical protein
MKVQLSEALTWNLIWRTARVIIEDLGATQEQIKQAVEKANNTGIYYAREHILGISPETEENPFGTVKAIREAAEKIAKYLLGIHGEG